MQRVLITGGSGFLGQHLAERLSKTHEVIISSRNQKQMLSAAHHLGVQAVPLDVSSYASTIEIFQRLKPEIVIHAAATKFVDLSIPIYINYTYLHILWKHCFYNNA